jgi:hypothetical protein
MSLTIEQANKIAQEVYEEKYGQRPIRIYVAGLLSHNADGTRANAIQFLEHIRQMNEAAVSLITLGYAPFSPALDHQFFFFTHKIDEKMIKAYSMAWLEVCDLVYVISGEGSGTGVDAELERAKELGIPIYRTTRFISEDFPPPRTSGV